MDDAGLVQLRPGVLPTTDVGEIMSVDSLVAVKVSQDEERMCDELSLLKKHADDCQCGLLARPLSMDIAHKNGLCCYALTPVGMQHVTRSIAFRSEDMLFRVFLALLGLHKHALPLIHGDARIPNLIIRTVMMIYFGWI